MISSGTNMEKLFHLFDESTISIKNELGLSYLEALAKTGENVFENKVVQELDSFTKKRLIKQYDGIDINRMSNEDIRKAFQLAILKGMKEAIQLNHEMTPDAVCLFFSYLVGKLMSRRTSFRLLDPAYGTGNLVTAILNHTEKVIKPYGVEVDDILIKLAYIGANLQKHEVELYKQDALQPIFVEDVDLIVSDLPVGYYPHDIIAQDYELHADQDGHAFIHYLYIEKSLKHLKGGGFLVVMIPNFMFEDDDAKALNDFIKNHAIILGLLQLPLSMFKNDKFAKSIFILQKKGEGVKPPKQALLAEMPRFSNKKAMRGMIDRIDSWFNTNMSF